MAPLCSAGRTNARLRPNTTGWTPTGSNPLRRDLTIGVPQLRLGPNRLKLVSDDAVDGADNDRTDHNSTDDDSTADDSTDTEIEPAIGDRSPLPFQDLSAPEPLAADPPAAARFGAFVLILVGGALGGLVGYGVGDVMYDNSTWAAVGALIGGLTGAIGVGVVANLTLRAMNEWEAVKHPEDENPGDRRKRERQWSRRHQ